MAEMLQDPIKRVLFIILVIACIPVITGWIVLFYKTFKESRGRDDGK